MNFIPKDYVSVATRVDQFHTDHEKDISIDTVFTLQGDVACFKAIVKTKKGTFSGSSFGKLGREKAFEKLETVAVGRALAFAGYETRDGIASKEEMEVFESNEKDRNNAPQSHETHQEVVWPTDWIDKPKIASLIEKLKSGELVASSGDEAVKIARQYFKVSKDNAEIIKQEFSKHIV